MTKTQSRRKSVLKTVTKTTEKALPILDKGLTTVGKTAKNVAEVSIPVVEKGVSTVYGTMSTGFDLGVKGAKTLARGVSKRRRSRRQRKSSRKSRSHRKH